MSTTTTTVRLDVPAEHRYLSLIGACIVELLARVEQLDEPEVLPHTVQLAIHELCTNIVEHAYASAGGRIAIVFSLVEPAGDLVVELADTGRPFDPEAIPEPDLDVGQIRGYGLFLARTLLDEMEYLPHAGGNRWRLMKRLRAIPATTVQEETA